MTDWGRHFRCGLSLPVLFAGPALLGCADILGIEETSVADDGETPLDPRWACRDDPAGTTELDEITIRVSTKIAGTQTPLPDVSVAVCSPLGDCHTALQEFTTDADGAVDVVVDVGEDGFRGYLRFAGQMPDEGGDIQPMFWFFSRAPLESFDLEAQLLPAAGWDGLRADLGVPERRPDEGDFSFSASTCETNAEDNPIPAEGVQVTLRPESPNSARFYLGSTGGLVGEEAQPETTATGRGGIFNVRAGSITAVMSHGGEQVAEVTGLRIQAGTLTTVDIYP